MMRLCKNYQYDTFRFNTEYYRHLGLQLFTFS